MESLYTPSDICSVLCLPIVTCVLCCSVTLSRVRVDCLRVPWQVVAATDAGSTAYLEGAHIFALAHMVRPCHSTVIALPSH